MSNSNNKIVKTRIQNKRDFEINWRAASFIPLAGELIIYKAETDSEGNILQIERNNQSIPVVPVGAPGEERTTPFTYERFKIGDGVTAISDLPFCSISADNIYFDEDITITTPVGNIGITNGSGVIPSAGKNLKQVFEAIWTKELSPTVTYPYVTINTAHQYKEVGASVTPAYSVTLNPGLYEYGPATGITAKTWAVSFDGTTKTSASDSFNNITITEGACCNISATATYIAGTVPVTNLGNKCASKQIAAGSVTNSKNLFTGYRPNFYGFKTEAVDLTSLDSTAIRRLTNQGSITAPVASASCATSWMQFFYAVPKGRKASLSAKDSNNLPLTVKSTEVTVNHEGSASSTYTVFYINNDAAYGATTLALTWG